MCIIVSMKAITSALHTGPLSVSQSAVRIKVIWPIRGQHHPLWACLSSPHVAIYYENEAGAWQQTKIYSALISWIPCRGGGTSQKFWQGGKIQDEAFLHWNELEQCEFDNWQGVMHDAQVNIEFEFASITSLLCGWEFLNYTTSKCISSVKFKNWKLDTDWYFVMGMFSVFDGCEVSCVTPPHPSAAPSSWWLVMIFTSWLYSSPPPQRVLNHPPWP